MERHECSMECHKCSMERHEWASASLYISYRGFCYWALINVRSSWASESDEALGATEILRSGRALESLATGSDCDRDSNLETLDCEPKTLPLTYPIMLYH